MVPLQSLFPRMSGNLTFPSPPAVYLLLGSLPLLVLSESITRSHTGTALFKMLSSVAFISGPIFLTTTEWSPTQSLITTGLLFSLAGDYFLIPSRSEFHNMDSNPSEEKGISISFQLGVVAFAAAHIAYILAFFQDTQTVSWESFATTFIATMAIAKWLGVIYPPPHASSRSNMLDLTIPGDMKPLVLIYATIISFMFATAVSTTPLDVSTRWQYQRVFGAGMFVASDVYVAKDAFKKTPGKRGWVQSAFGYGLYFWGQMVIAGLVEG
ncbi:YhhN-like protein [Aspergillus alliaceus]|uniref:YhhN-like protein n=1 Tax=Petromyces alliaceus TaxID=209559 RepID=A0A5N7CCT7_PETAA|nr:YhhN-like protein [Aspergillus alliaceus]